MIDWARSWAKALGTRCESADYLARIEAWRQHWRPSRVRFLLVAESHVAEVPDDLDAQVVLPGLASPAGYCRLVYCLGYGESEVCTPRPRRNTGTWQYWDLLGQVAGGLGNTQPRKAGSSLDARLQWKLDALATLQRRGIWLVDAAAVALYAPGGRRTCSGSTMSRLIRESWERFVWPTLSEEPIARTWIVGRGVRRALDRRPELAHSGLISQPQDRNVARYRQELAELVADAAAVCPGT